MILCSILLISPEPWEGNFVSKHHYALTLVRRGFKVYFLNPSVDINKGIKLENVGENGNLFEVYSPPVARALRFYPRLLRNWLEARWLQQLEKVAGVKIDIVWLFENSRFFDMRFAGERLKIYHQVDLNQSFQVETAAKTADICFSTTDFISQKLRAYNSRTYKIHHGGSVVSNKPDLPANLAKNFRSGKIHVGYIGNLDICYLDVPLLTGLVKDFPKINFHFVGSFLKNGALSQACADASNVIWWGKVKSGLIPSILVRCNILLITYLAEEFREQLASPHKVMEYLASGKVVVATYTDEYKDKHHLLEMVDKSKDFPESFARVAEHLNEYNSSEKQAARIEFAQKYNYDRQLDTIITILKKHGLGKVLSEGSS